MEDGSNVVDLIPVQLGGKPVIYLFPPKGNKEMDIVVNLSLVPQWKFSAVYPVVPTKSQAPGGEIVTWSVRTHADQSMTEKLTGLRTSYLYWEAE